MGVKASRRRFVAGIAAAITVSSYGAVSSNVICEEKLGNLATEVSELPAGTSDEKRNDVAIPDDGWNL